MIARQLANLVVLGVLPALGLGGQAGETPSKAARPPHGEFCPFSGETWKLPSPQDMKHQEVID